MPILIGTDEAGYGPNLGPLVITATSWTIPEGAEPADLWTLLGDVVVEFPKRGDKRLHVADSKKVYSAGKSLARLERGVHAFLRHLGADAASVGSLGVGLAGAGFREDYENVQRDVVDELALPVQCSDAECDEHAARVTDAMTAAGIRLLDIQSCIMFPPEFNRRVAETDSKGKVLSAETLALVRAAADHPDAPATGWVVCDKHGGRNRYDDIISTAFDDRFVFRLEESRPISRYRLGQLDFCFRTKAEEVLPVALASMVAKYVREVVMLQFNRFWQHHLPDLKPTKGYPVDALRFWDDIAEKAASLGITRSEIWRNR
ncbi:MAG TPA: hypothetical protein EYG03_13870 [Planctomycetes bacterium]|nr:hypothetical protein [Fuerstiella sp.]HIK93049.1 hypothetical protein [Planctomycetota bacterium]